MAKYTNEIALGNAWVAIAQNKTTVLIQRLVVTEIRLLVSDTTPGETESGHVLSSGALKTVSFDGLPPTTIWARGVNVPEGQTVPVQVTAF